ncbi:3-keto-disaccharide hydrolase [Thermogutta sp.]|uniref:3-keto-disaccharide hydrolase n=1 Tax=Thermogutta sp. TaxID=1962930 RepID=UPI003C79A351
MPRDRAFLLYPAVLTMTWWLACCLSLTLADDQNASPPASDPGEISLFDGATLHGWTVKCKPQDEDKRHYWKVVDGTITAEVPPNSKHDYIWLVSDQEFSDFELRVKVQTYSTSTGNSGIQVRSRYDDTAHYMDGPQVDINPPGPWRCGFIYDETRGAQVWLWPDVGRPANAKPEHAPAGWKWYHADLPESRDAWNDVRIVCQGLRIKTWVNGVPIADYNGAGRLDDEFHKKRNVGLCGHIALQIHPGGKLLIRFKDIVLRLPAQSGDSSH